jgi:streptogramin lyase
MKLIHNLAARLRCSADKPRGSARQPRRSALQPRRSALQPRRSARQPRVCALAAASFLALVLAGCSSGLSSSAFQATNPQPSATGIHGSVHGGQAPIAGATIQLYAAGTSANGSAATPLIASTVQTDAGGNFNITGAYSCAGDPMVYLVAIGGNPGLSQGANNSAIAQMVALGDCNTLQANAATTFISLNEITTVASVYALAGFTTDYDHVGYAGSNRTGFASAINAMNAIVSIAGGNAIGSTPGSGITLPTAKLISLADSASACVNSSGPASDACSTLFTATTATGGSAPTDEIAALASLARHPALNVVSVYQLSPTTPPFAGGLTSAPADWTLSIQYTGGGLSLPSGIAIDASGNAWVANEGGNAVTQIGTGAFLSGAGGYASSAIAGAQGIAADASGNIWLANTEANNVLKLSSSGAITATLTAGINGPVSVAPDRSGNIWVANFTGNSLAGFTSSGSPLPGSPFTNAALIAPTGLAVDPANNLWLSSSQPGTVALFSNAGVFQNSFTDGFLVAPGGLALDAAANKLWAAGTGINGLTGLAINSTAATPLTNSPFTAVQQPLAVAVDSASTVWTLSNITAGAVYAFDASGNPLPSSSGLGSLNQPVGLAVDASGNLWTTAAGDSSVTQFLGLVAPTPTPIVNYLGNPAP